MNKISLVGLNALDSASFGKVLSGVYEHSPWVITEAARSRPFSTMKELQASCEAAIDRASHEAQVLLIQAHPDLAVKLDQLPHLTEFSKKEQSKAGFAMLKTAEIDELDAAMKKAQYARALDILLFYVLQSILQLMFFRS